MGAFHAYDIRGIYNVDFDKEIVYKVGFFLPELLDTDRILVGRDCRVSSDEIHEYLLKGITDAGADVYDAGLCTTPMVYFGTAKFGYKASVQITASHNPKEYNGMKVSRENALPVGLETGLGTIQKWIEEGRPTPKSDKKGTVREIDFKEEYLDFLRGFALDSSNVKAVFDLSNGMSCLLAKKLFGEDKEYIFDTMDGTFPNHEPNPLIAENRVQLCELVKKENADLGVIFDGDADRVMFIDEKARFVSPDLMIALLGRYFLGERGLKGKVLQDIRSSKSISEYLEPMGATVETWKVGRANAALKLREIDGIWGGELAGHYYFRDFFYSDSGLLAALLVLRVVAGLKREGISLGSFIDSISHYKTSGEVNFKIEEKQAAMDFIRDWYSKEETPSKYMDFDGYRLEFKDWWFNIRPSNTEPYLRFICEAASEDLLEKKLTETKRLLAANFGATL